MKKILLILSFILLSTITSFSQTNINIWGGYSWINGLIGIETQYQHFGIGAGYMPTKMPYYGDKISSFSGSLTYYSNSIKKLYPYTGLNISLYGSIGVASAGYRHQDINFNEEIIPMTYGMIGVKGHRDKFYIKSGLGYGWCKKYESLTFEIGIGYRLFTNN